MEVRLWYQDLLSSQFEHASLKDKSETKFSAIEWHEFYSKLHKTRIDRNFDFMNNLERDLKDEECMDRDL
jgi:hypothetical protein